MLRQAVGVGLRVDHLGPIPALAASAIPLLLLLRRPRVLLERVLAREQRPRALGAASELLVAEGVAGRSGGWPAALWP